MVSATDLASGRASEAITTVTVAAAAPAAPRGATGPARRHQLGLALEVDITPDEGRRAVEDPLVRAAVVGERQSPAWETRPDVVDLRVQPAVDRLLLGTDH